MSHVYNPTTSRESPQPMDVRADDERSRNKIFVKTCPFCNDEFVIPIVFVSHLAGHISFHSDRNLFKCNICDLVNRSSTVVALHVETHHAVKRAIFLDSAKAKLITKGNLTERDRMISVLGKSDDPSKNFWLPYQNYSVYWCVWSDFTTLAGPLPKRRAQLWVTESPRILAGSQAYPPVQV